MLSELRADRAGVYTVESSGWGSIDWSSSPGVRAGVEIAEYESPRDDVPVRDWGRDRREGE